MKLLAPIPGGRSWALKVFRYSFSEAIPIFFLYIYYEDYVKRFLKKFVRVVSEIYRKALKVQILNEVALIQVVRKRVSFQDRKNENTPKFPSIKI